MSPYKYVGKVQRAVKTPEAVEPRPFAVAPRDFRTMPTLSLRIFSVYSTSPYVTVVSGLSMRSLSAPPWATGPPLVPPRAHLGLWAGRPCTWDQPQPTSRPGAAPKGRSEFLGTQDPQKWQFNRILGKFVQNQPKLHGPGRVGPVEGV